MNPLISDRDVDFLLYEVHGAEALLELPAFADHARDAWDLYVATCRKLARELLYPAYRPLDRDGPRLTPHGVVVHPLVAELYPRLVETGLLTATRPARVGGQALPLTVATVANAYLMAANLSLYGYAGLTMGAARLIESFGTPELQQRFMEPMYAGEWTGTMALTEPQAGSSLSDVATLATPCDAGHYLIRGSKVFISGGDHDAAANIVHLTLARIEGAPAGIKGVSLFAIPKRRHEDGRLVDNDCSAAGVFHKLGWRGLPSIALNFGERGECHGWLVGEAHRGITYMFQMMNEARLMVGLNGVATALVAYHESLEYARTRPQGRKAAARDPRSPQVPIIEHADVRRMLLRQKAIVEGGLSLLVATARYADLSEHAATEAERARAAALLGLLTPIAKSFPAERGFESNALAVQIHGGYGYTGEYPVEAWLRDQKLNSLHEGTTGIQSLDLLGRKVLGDGGAALGALVAELERAVADARAAGVDDGVRDALATGTQALVSATTRIGEVAASGRVEDALLHSADYLDALSTLVIGWQWLVQATVATRAQPGAQAAQGAFYRGKIAAAKYWARSELSRLPELAARAASGERSFADLRADEL